MTVLLERTLGAMSLSKRLLYLGRIQLQLNEYIQNNVLYSFNGTLRPFSTTMSLPVASGSGRAAALSEPSTSMQGRILSPCTSSMKRGFASNGIHQQDENAQEKKKKNKGKGGGGGGGTPTAQASSPPESLEYHGTPSIPTVPDNANIFKKAVLWMGGYYSKQSTYMRAAGELNVCVKEQSLNPALFQGTSSCLHHNNSHSCLHMLIHNP